MIIGHFFLIRELECSYGCTVEYDVKTKSYCTTRSIGCKAIIDDNKETPRLLINGKHSLHGMRAFLTIHPIEPSGVINWEEQQTCSFDFPRAPKIETALGSLSYESGRKDSELNLTLERGLYGEVCLGDRAFSELWSAATHGRNLYCFKASVFGASIEQKESWRGSLYHWNVRERPNGIFFCEFGFSFN